MALVLIPVIFWYGHAHRVYLDTGLTLFGNAAYGTDKWGNWDMLWTWSFWNRIIFQRVAEKHLSWFGFALLLWGLVRVRRTGRALVFDVWLAAVLVYSLIVTNGSFVHEHYQLAFVPPAVAVMGQVIAGGLGGRLYGWRYATTGMLLTGVLVSAAYRYTVLMAWETPAYDDVYRLGRVVDRLTAPEDLIAAVNEGNPSDLYLAGRKGWCLNAAHLDPAGAEFLAGLAARGAAYAVGRHALFQDPDRRGALRRIMATHLPVYDDGRVFVLALRKSGR